MKILINALTLLSQLEELKKSEEEQGIFREEVRYNDVMKIIANLMNGGVQKDSVQNQEGSSDSL